MGRLTSEELSKKMDAAVIRRLENYVYRLIDPRNGETFYVGVGKNKRVLDHVRGALRPAETAPGMEPNELDYEDEANLKLARINQIRKAGFEVGHIIHRHGITDPKTARLVEAALIDAYPGISNRLTGHGSTDYGCRHLEEIIRAEALEEFVPTEPLVLISIGQTFEEDTESVYENTCKAWRASLDRAKAYCLVLAHSGGIVRGVFRPTEWVEATRANFPKLAADMPTRIGFHGKEAEPEVQSQYMNHRVPTQYRAPGAANPFRYIDV